MFTDTEREQRVKDLKSKIKSLKKEMEDLNTELYTMNIEIYYLKSISNRNPVINKDIERIETGNLCMETYPCQHDCTFYYKDGSTMKIRYNGKYITDNYFDNLNEKDKMHFYRYLKNSVYRE